MQECGEGEKRQNRQSIELRFEFLHCRLVVLRQGNHMSPLEWPRVMCDLASTVERLPCVRNVNDLSAADINGSAYVTTWLQIRPNENSIWHALTLTHDSSSQIEKSENSHAATAHHTNKLSTPPVKLNDEKRLAHAKLILRVNIGLYTECDNLTRLD